MKWIARGLSSLSLAGSVLTLIRFEPGPRASSLCWMFKALAGALTPFLAAAGGLGALLGILSGDRPARLAGAAGAVIAARHVARVTAPHRAIDRAARERGKEIPPALQARMLPSRFSPWPKDPPVVPWQRDVVIGSHVETGEPLLADVWQPPADVPRTGLAVIYMHGSAWHYLDKDVGTRRFFRHLAAQGHVIVDLAYTLAPKAQLEAMVADVKRAIAWVKTHAAELGVNPARVVLMGASAGGHLALLAAYTPNDPRLQPADVTVDTSVRAVVSYYGPTDMESTYCYFRDRLGEDGARRNGWPSLLTPLLERLARRARFLPPGGRPVPMGDILPNLLGGRLENMPERYRFASPIHHVGPHCPPTLLLHGTHDWFGLTADARRLDRALRGAGVTSIYVEFPDTDHAFDLAFPKWAPAAQAATYDTERFLALML